MFKLQKLLYFMLIFTIINLFRIHYLFKDLLSRQALPPAGKSTISSHPSNSSDLLMLS